MSEEDALWDRIYAAFVAHQKPWIDHTPQMALDRVAAKCIERIGLSFNKSNCTVHEESLSFDALKRLRRHHGRSRVDPRFEDWALVILQYNGQRFVIDGNTRVNKWVNEESHISRLALIIEPRGHS